MASQELFTQRRDALRARILDMSIPELANNYDAVEDEILNGVLQILIDSLESHAAEVKGSVFIIGSHSYQFFSEYRKTTRELVVSFAPVFSSREKMRNITIHHDGFGLLKTTELILPTRVSRILSPAQPIIEAWIESLYNSLEVAVINGVGALQLLPLKNIGDIFLKHAEQNHVSEVARQAWFSVSNLDEMVFRYQFSYSQLLDLVRHFKDNQIPEFSPFQCIVALLTTEIHDAVLDGPAEYTNGVFTVPFTSLGSVSTDVCFWNAERQMFQCPTLSAIDIGLVNEQFDLQINFPTPLAEVIQELLKEVGPLLYDQFERNLTEYKSTVSIFRRIASPIQKQKAYQTVVQFVSDVIVTTISGIWQKVTTGI